MDNSVAKTFSLPATVLIPQIEISDERLAEIQALAERLEKIAHRIEDAVNSTSISWSEKDAAEFLGLSHITLQRIRLDGRIAHSMIGRNARYTRKHLEEYLENNERRTQAHGRSIKKAR